LGVDPTPLLELLAPSPSQFIRHPPRFPGGPTTPCPPQPATGMWSLASIAALVFFAAAAPAVSVHGSPSLSLLRGGGAVTVDRYAASMQPAIVASLLAKVEHEWIGKAMKALSGALTSDSALSAVQKSCVKVAGSIVEGSSGNKADVAEYMEDVCSCDSRNTEEQQGCLKFKDALAGLMSDDESRNRDGFDYPGFCAEYYTNVVLKDAIAEKERLHKTESPEGAAPGSEAEAKAAKDAEDQSRQEAARQEAADEASNEAVEAQVSFAKRAAEKRVQKEVEQSSENDMESEHEVREEEAMAREEAQKAAAWRKELLDAPDNTPP